MPRAARILVWPLLAVVAAHTFIIATWVGPSTPVRQAIGADALRSYVVPMFEQSWMIFAPTPRRVAVNLELRAEVVDPETGEKTITDWVDVVAGEDAMIRGNPFPPRMSLAGRRVANMLNASMGKMNDEQKTLVDENYLTTPVSELGTRLAAVSSEGAASAGTVADYMTYDRVAVDLASLYLGSLYDGDVAFVQYRTAMRYVPPFSERNEKTIDDAVPTYFDYGWRPASTPADETVELFRPFVQTSVVEAS